MRNAKKALAASFVVTFSAGCESNSSQPPTAPTVDIGPAPSAAPGGPSAGDAGSAMAPASMADGAAVPALAPAPSSGSVEKLADGTCLWRADVNCPKLHGRTIPCNPPPPRPVQCPK